MSFLSKISTPEIPNKYSSKLRSFAEIAYFVRQLPYVNFESHRIWRSVDFFLTMQKGTIFDHAILMASMFRAIDEEDVEN